VTPQVAGTVLAIEANDTDFVEAGQLLVRLDAADAQVALQQAEAQLGQTVREVRTLYANNGVIGATIAAREADVAHAKSELARTEQDLARREALTGSGAVSGEELGHARDAMENARSTLAAAQAAASAARGQLVSSVALTAGATVETHPNVQRAAARVREAYLALTRTTLPAPVSGIVARRSVQLGARVAAGATLMSIVPLDQVWVEANFKENQLARMRIGQPVTLVADLYGGKVTYQGRVAGVGAGTGAAFSLLPAQNATGNWIKVVQRVPVRVTLDAQQLREHPLRVGLSMTATVDVANGAGKALADTPSGTAAAAATAVFDDTSHEADARIARIVAANLGRAAAAVAPDGPAPAATAPAVPAPAVTAPVVTAPAVPAPAVTAPATGGAALHAATAGLVH
jgi:membrane fusion protein (multidrug efflux system)